MGLFSDIAKTVSGIAKTALGSVSQARSVLNFNPSLSGLVFPPQVSMGLAAAKVVGGMVGVKVPSQDDLVGFAQGKLDTILGGIRKQTKEPLDSIEAILSGKGEKLDYATRIFSQTMDIKGLSAEEILDKIQWLL